MRKNCSSNQEKLLKFEAEGREFAKFQVSMQFWDIPSELMWIMDGPIQRRLGKNAFIEAKHEKKEEEKSNMPVYFFSIPFFLLFTSF